MLKTQSDKLPKDETEEERMLRLEMEALAAEQKAQMQAVSLSFEQLAACATTSLLPSHLQHT